MTWKLAQYTLEDYDLYDAAREGMLYAVLDAAGAPLVPQKMDSLGRERAQALYSSRSNPELRTAAPYLARVDVELMVWIQDNLWEEPWGILIESTMELTDLRRHLRQFLLVDDPQGRQLYFRFYDPRVLKTFLPTCNAQELAELYGPNIDAYIIRGTSRDVFTRFVLEWDTKAATRRSLERLPGRQNRILFRQASCLTLSETFHYLDQVLQHVEAR